MLLSYKLRLSLSAAAVLILLLALCGCPQKQQAGQSAPDKMGAPPSSGAGETPAPGADSSPGGEVTAADYLSGKAGSEIVTTPDGIAMPQGWPQAEVVPPAGSVALPGEKTAEPWAGGAVQWMQPFSNDSGWTNVSQSIEAGLARSGFQLVRGEKTPVEPKLDNSGEPAVGFTHAERLYRHKDGKFIVYLRADLRLQPEAPGEPRSSYELELVFMDTPMPLPATTTLEDLK